MESDRKLAKAQLRQIKWLGDKSVADQNKGLTVQFNPSTLRVSYSNQVQSNDQSQGAAKQYVGRGNSKLSLELIFDVSMPSGDEQTAQPTSDVQNLTKSLFDFMKPVEQPGGKAATRYVAPAVRLSWGSFSFDGVVESMDETLELWSEEGIPIRATVTLSMSQQGIVFHQSAKDDGTPVTPGTAPLAPARSGESLQRLAGRTGQEANWKSIARANEIANPRHLAPGQLVRLSPQEGGPA